MEEGEDRQTQTVKYINMSLIYIIPMASFKKCTPTKTNISTGTSRHQVTCETQSYIYI